jgi:ribosomal protein S18 acetylase RimI-like enzyme
MKRNIATVFVAVEQATGNVCGYYTLSMASVVLDLLPEALARKMPRYPAVPAIRLGRLAVHLKAGNQGLGTHLLMDAMKRSVRNEVAWAAFIVDAKDGKAAGFYRKFGFHSFIDDPCHLFIMRKTIEPLFS